jgi:predicted amidohydrolase
MIELAKLTEEIKMKISDLAISYNVNIISGSMPVFENNDLYNVSYLLHRDGRVDEYRKIHITPNEKNITE